MILDLIYLIGGILLLYFGGDYLVKGSVSLANHFKVSPFFIGIVIISFGTSFPELIVSTDAALKGHPDISLGNVVGSNIANIALALGLIALIVPLAVKKKNIWIDLLILFFLSGLTILFSFIGSGYDFKIQRLEGMIFLLILVAYYAYLIIDSRKNRKEIKVEIPKYAISLSFIIIIGAFAVLAVGAEGVIEGGTNIAKSMGISERIISLTVIAFGTSLPEIATSYIAALKKQLDISIANVIGSNIFNIAGVLGITSLIKPIHINNRILNYDYWWMMGFLSIIILMIYIFKQHKISRIEGGILVAAYVTYFYLLF